MHLLIAVGLASLALAGVAHAQSQIPVAAVTPSVANLPDVDPAQIELTPDSVGQFLASLPSMVSLARNLDREHGRSHPIRIDESLGMLLVPHLFVPEVAARVTRELQRFGFASYSQWADMAYSIGLAAEASEFTGTIDLSEQKEGLRRDIEREADLTGEQKRAALEDLERKFAALAMSEPRPGNREAVEPFIDRLRAATGG